MTTKPTNEHEKFIDALVDELAGMPDDKVLEGVDPAAVQANGLRLLQAAKVRASKTRLAAAKAGVASAKVRSAAPVADVSVDEARRFIVRASNDPRYTLAARSLGDLPDEEVLKLYRRLKDLEGASDGGER
jgi:hypothetical protein